MKNHLMKILPLVQRIRAQGITHSITLAPNGLAVGKEESCNLEFCWT
jgi:hypothetical protein